MPRLMSVAYTEAAVRARIKTVTRRAGWLHLEPGDFLTLCPKVMGRRKGEPLDRIVASWDPPGPPALLEVSITLDAAEVSRG